MKRGTEIEGPEASEVLESNMKKSGLHLEPVPKDHVVSEEFIEALENAGMDAKTIAKIRKVNMKKKMLFGGNVDQIGESSYLVGTPKPVIMDKNTKVGGPWLTEMEKVREPVLSEESKQKIREAILNPKPKTGVEYFPPKYDPFDNDEEWNLPLGINPEPLREALPIIQEIGKALTDDDIYGWIQLYSGRKFFPLKPTVEDVDIEDIAHSLSNMCRFTGHVREFYSVAQHSVLVSYLCGANNALYGLLHDATEAYLVDMPKPIKRLETFSNFREIEGNIMLVIAKKFGLPSVEPPAVKQADIKILATEARDLMAPLHPDWKQPCEPYPFKIEPLPPAEAKKLFMDRYRQLIGA